MLVQNVLLLAQCCGLPSLPACVCLTRSPAPAAARLCPCPVLPLSLQVVDHPGFTWTFMALVVANTVLLAMTTAGEGAGGAVRDAPQWVLWAWLLHCVWIGADRGC